MKSLPTLLRRLRSQRGQTAVEYMMVISVLSIAIYFCTGAFCEAFSLGMDTLTSGLSESLTTDGIRF